MSASAFGAEPAAPAYDVPVWARETETQQEPAVAAEEPRTIETWASDWQPLPRSYERLPQSFVRPSKVKRDAASAPADEETIKLAQHIECVAPALGEEPTIELVRHTEAVAQSDNAPAQVEHAVGEFDPAVEESSFISRGLQPEPLYILRPDPSVIDKTIIEEAIEQTAQVPPVPEGTPPAPAVTTTPVPDGSDPAAELAAEPSYELGKINEILPYADYEPDPQVLRDDPCMNQCPRPEGGCPPPTGEGRGAAMCPAMVQLSDAPFEGRLFNNNVFCWQASNVWYHPLYFEDPALERYGHTHCCVVQPFVSAGRFSAQFLALPYQMSIDPMCKCVYPLGYYRPGECAPKLCYQPPWNFDAAVVTAGFYTGMTYLIP